MRKNKTEIILMFLPFNSNATLYKYLNKDPYAKQLYKRNKKAFIYYIRNKANLTDFPEYLNIQETFRYLGIKTIYSFKLFLKQHPNFPKPFKLYETARPKYNKNEIDAYMQKLKTRK